MIYLYVLTIVILFFSFIKDRERTIKGIKKGLNKFNNILPSYLVLLMIISIILLLSEEFIIKYLSQNNVFAGTFMSVVIGSITMMPGFIAYPLAGVLLERGVPYIILGGFVTSLMLVGIVTYPVEKVYFGKRVAILRNIFGFIISIGIALGIGLFYGEIL